MVISPGHAQGEVGYWAGWFGEAQVSYGGPGAAERAQLAGQTCCRPNLGIEPIEARAECRGGLALPGLGGGQRPRCRCAIGAG